MNDKNVLADMDEGKRDKKLSVGGAHPTLGSLGVAEGATRVSLRSVTAPCVTLDYMLLA